MHTYILLANGFSEGEESAESIKSQHQTLVLGTFDHFQVIVIVIVILIFSTSENHLGLSEIPFRLVLGKDPGDSEEGAYKLAQPH